MSGLYGVVPLRMERIIFDIERFDLLVGDLFAFLVLSGVDVAGDSEARACGGCGNELDDDLVRDQGLAAPVLGDEGEHAVLDAVPFAGAGRVMGDGDGQAGLVGEVLQLELPEPDAGAIAAAPSTSLRAGAVGGDEQAADGWRLRPIRSHQRRMLSTAKAAVS